MNIIQTWYLCSCAYPTRHPYWTLLQTVPWEHQYSFTIYKHIWGLYFFLCANWGGNHYLDSLSYFERRCRCLCLYSTYAPLEAQPITSIHYSFISQLHCASTSCTKSLCIRGKLPNIRTGKITVVVYLYLWHKVLAMLVRNSWLYGGTLPLFAGVDHLSSILYASCCSSTTDFEASIFLT